jgi:hypothetical protein
VVKVEAMKLKENDHTSILEILPENIHVSPNTILNRNSPKKVIAIISIKDIRLTTIITGLRSDKKLALLLNFSDTRCNNTLEKAVATSAKGTDSKTLARSK